MTPTSLVAQGDGKHNCNKHMKATHGLDMGRLSVQTGQQTIGSGMVFSVETMNAALLTELVMDLLPFAFLQRKGRQASMKYLAPASYKLPSRTWFVDALKNKYRLHRKLLVAAFKSPRFCEKYALSFDGWRAAIAAKVMYAAKVSFLTEDLVPVELPLDICALTDKRAVTVAAWVRGALEKAGLPPANLIVLVSDGAERAVEEAFREGLDATDPEEDVEWREVARELHVNYIWCCDHRLSLVVKHSLRTAGMDRMIDMTDEMVRFVMKTPKIRALYDKAQGDVNVRRRLKSFPETRFAMRCRWVAAWSRTRRC